MADQHQDAQKLLQADLDIWQTPLLDSEHSKAQSQVRRRAALAVAMRRHCRLAQAEIARWLNLQSHESVHCYLTRFDSKQLIEAAATLCRHAGIPADEVYQPTWRRITHPRKSPNRKNPEKLRKAS